jgi:uncharacterized protein YggE
MGAADTLIAPDGAYAYVGQVGDGRTPETALAGISGPASRLEALFARMGIDSARIETASFSLGQAPERDGASAGSAAFRAERILRVHFRDFGRMQEFLRLAIQAGANTIRGVEFEYRDRGAIEALLMPRAVDQARASALRIAERMGVKLGLPLSATLQDLAGPPVGAFRAGAALESMAGGPGHEALYEIHPRKVQVSARVQVRYAIRR